MPNVLRGMDKEGNTKASKITVVGVLDGELEENITNLQEGADLEGHASQHHPSNWVEANDDDDDEGDESE
ncbi:hypothetical protein KY290_036859 [Solanum tuberosum]|uniref:Uncharacterized protein n=1 Tax=Solanum tuberosum TaxID=4113 RepID=A0ABQ7TVR4_SOLTU|nr:hypothetical protein KY289_036329 [Solanum tuberosum]KAH0639596.1 hypothetical protein KY285_036182 [Solanum tuberosum]KAH0738154.1 hypothetical protein KY290_036859 [Solanum tuberosum]